MKQETKINLFKVLLITFFTLGIYLFLSSNDIEEIRNVFLTPIVDMNIGHLLLIIIFYKLWE